MKPIMIIGIVLIVLGLAGMVLQGVTYTTRENIAEVGGVKVTVEKQKTVPIPLIAGGVSLVGGIVIVIIAARKPTSS
jgi:hypothetical protein